MTLWLLFINPHNKLVAKLLADQQIAIDLFKTHLPKDIAATLQWDTLQMLSPSSTTGDWRDLHSDLVFSCLTKKSIRSTHLLLFLEHQSTPQRFIPIRIARYVFNWLFDQYVSGSDRPDKLPNFIPCVLIHGAKGAYIKDLPSCFEDPELARKVLIEGILAIDVRQMDEEDILHRPGKSKTLEILLKLSHNPDFIPKFVQRVVKTLKSLSKEQVLDIAAYTMSVGGGKEKELEMIHNQVRRDLGEGYAAGVGTIADYLHNKGIQKGIQEGIQKGRIDTIRELARAGVDWSIISKATGLSPEQVR